MVLDLAPHHTEGIVSSVVVDVNSAETRGTSSWDPLLVGIVIHHDSSPCLADALFTVETHSNILAPSCTVGPSASCPDFINAHSISQNTNSSFDHDPFPYFPFPVILLSLVDPCPAQVSCSAFSYYLLTVRVPLVSVKCRHWCCLNWSYVLHRCVCRVISPSSSPFLNGSSWFLDPSAWIVMVLISAALPK